LLSISIVIAQNKSSINFSGYMFGDYYWIASHHDSEIEHSNGFWFRRIYFTYDHRLSPKLSTRIRLEMNSRGDFSTNSSALVPYIKDAYLKWKINDHHRLYLGISPPPTFHYIEHFWGYRFLEKTALDLQRWGPSREFGLSLRGDLTSSGNLQYHIMLGNGNGNKSEVNKGKKWMAAVRYFPIQQLVVEVYADWNDNNGRSDWMTYQLFAGYKSKHFRVGGSVSRQIRQEPEGDDRTLDLASLFAIWQTNTQWAVVVRADRQFDPNPKAASQQYLPFAPDAASVFLLGGVEYRPHPAVHLMPNVEVIYYDTSETGEEYTADIVPRLTFFYVFK
jgi:hypothetical protein